MIDNEKDKFNMEDDSANEEDEQWFFDEVNYDNIDDLVVYLERLRIIHDIPEVMPGRIRISDLFKYLDIFFNNYETVYISPVALRVADIIKEEVKNIADAYDVSWFERVVVAKSEPTTVILEYKIDFLNARPMSGGLSDIVDLSDGLTVFVDRDGKHMILSIYLEEFILVKYKEDTY